MDLKFSRERERVRKRLKDDLEYFSKIRNKNITESEIELISRSIAFKIDLDDPIFGHKGTSWIANEILRNKYSSNNKDK
ncbi:hypothetical protein [Planomicrobium okeanokoites]|uniref:hypothetical protein n=1 Tax=Planomicrobium okeanokoites TaxID=244 RepID=UPI0024921C5B|nr:hypothetical protein [Planomicrobium okeanokoites]